ncbi:MarR family transcriptional regulator [Haladaptatus halobius]|uniref:MarR family transcriptional regulator n=1 Tax=Haladaptatus halobius TaxID=2884875 RepID=UPI001D0A2843|nr:MarR family transcriptional regulator [Haladaptatus halobius]
MGTMTDERKRDTRGQYAKETTDDDILAAIRESEFPAVTARWVADTVEMERPSAHRRLEVLHEDGEVERGKLSPRVVIWWIPENE